MQHPLGPSAWDPATAAALSAQKRSPHLPAVESSWEVRPEGLDPRSSNFHVSWRELLARDEDFWV